MRITLTGIAAALLCLGLGVTSSAEPEKSVPELAQLSVLYAGDPQSDRSKHFVEFLTPWFKKVGNISLSDLSQSAAKDYDVVVADWKRRYVDGSYKRDPHGLKLPETFSKPVIMLGAVGGEIARQTKIDWL